MKTLMKFSAPWCGPCKQLDANMLNANLGNTKVEKINVDVDEASVKQYGIRAVPTLVLLQDGVEVKRKSGSMTASELESWVAE